MSIRKISQYSLDGAFIKSWDSAKEAQDVLGVKNTNIIKVCKGKRYSAGGYLWKYEDTEIVVPPIANFISKNLSETTKVVNIDAGTLSSNIVTNFEPKDDLELAALHKIDLTKYKISQYWSKLRPDGKFTSSVLASLRKIGDVVSSKELEDVIKKVSQEVFKPTSLNINKIDKSARNDKAIIFCIADEHIACSNDNSLFENKWDESEYRARKLSVVEALSYETLKHGTFDKVIMLNLGDNLDGFSGQTTRGGHTLPQNMTNKQAIETYLRVNIQLWDSLLTYFPYSDFEEHDMENSNHGGNGWDAAANIAVKAYLDAKYPKVVSKVSYEKTFGMFKYGCNNIVFTHGKDDKMMRNPLPLNLNDATETKIKQIMDIFGIHHKSDEQTFVLKGDIHKFNWNSGKFFKYINCPSVMGATGWIMENFGQTEPGIFYLILDKYTKRTDFGFVNF